MAGTQAPHSPHVLGDQCNINCISYHFSKGNGMVILKILGLWIFVLFAIVWLLTGTFKMGNRERKLYHDYSKKD